MQHSDSQRIDTTTLVFLKNPMYVRARMFLWLLWFDVLLFVCVNQRDLRETLGVHLCNIDRVLLREYSHADSADHAEECSKLHYFAEKDRLVKLMLFCGF